MKSVTRLLLVSVLLVGVNLAVGLTPAFAKTVKGTIVSMDGGMLVVRTLDGQEQHYTLGTGVTVPADVSSGTMVQVTVGDTGDQVTVVSAISADAGMTPSTTSGSSTYNTPSTTTSTSTTTTTSSQTDVNNQYANTASPLWAYGLVGLVALAGAMAFRRWRVSQRVRGRLV